MKKRKADDVNAQAYAMVWISYWFCLVSTPRGPSLLACGFQARGVTPGLFHAEQAKESKKVW